jgi:HSP20 family protein
VFDTPAFAFPRTSELAFPRNFEQQFRHPYQVHEDDKEYTVSVDVPGVKAEDMNIKVEENVLHLSGGRKIKKENGYSESKFDYRMTLGDDVEVDKISASLEDGVLRLTAPKMEVKKPAARVISITSTPTTKKLGVGAADEKKEEA